MKNFLRTAREDFLSYSISQKITVCLLLLSALGCLIFGIYSIFAISTYLGIIAISFAVALYTMAVTLRDTLKGFLGHSIVWKIIIYLSLFSALGCLIFGIYSIFAISLSCSIIAFALALAILITSTLFTLYH